MSTYSREAGQPMSTEHRRPLLAFVAVFVTAILVVVGAVRSDALRQFVQERTVDVVAATTLDLADEPEPGSTDTEPEVDAAGAEPVSLPAQSATAEKAEKARADKAGAEKGKAKGHAHAKAPGKAKGHAHAKAPGRAKGHAHAEPPAWARGHVPGATPGHTEGKAKGKSKAKGHQQGRGHAKGHGKGHRNHGH